MLNNIHTHSRDSPPLQMQRQSGSFHWRPSTTTRLPLHFGVSPFVMLLSSRSTTYSCFPRLYLNGLLLEKLYYCYCYLSTRKIISLFL